jgi:hypothetical protein
LTCKSWEEYLELREESGITAYGKAFKALLSKRQEEEVKFGAIEALTQELHVQLKTLSAEKLATIWYWELTDTWSVGYTEDEDRVRGRQFLSYKPEGVAYKVNKPNYAFRAVAFPGSPILPMLGIDDVQGCFYLLTNNLGTRVAQWALSTEHPFKNLSNKMFANTGHGDNVVNEQGQRVEFHQCKHCMEHLTTQTIRGWRASKTAGEKEFMRNLTVELNKIDRPYGAHEMDELFDMELQ